MSRFPQALSGLCLVIPSPAYPFPEFCSDFSLPLPCGAVSGCCFLFFSVNVMMIWACHGMGNGYVDTPLFLLFLPIYPFTHQLSTYLSSYSSRHHSILFFYPRLFSPYTILCIVLFHELPALAHIPSPITYVCIQAAIYTQVQVLPFVRRRHSTGPINVT